MQAGDCPSLACISKNIVRQLSRASGKTATNQN